MGVFLPIEKRRRKEPFGFPVVQSTEILIANHLISVEMSLFRSWDEKQLIIRGVSTSFSRGRISSYSFRSMLPGPGNTGSAHSATRT